MRRILAAIGFFCLSACGSEGLTHSTLNSWQPASNVDGRYPQGPEDSMTPGSLCKRPTQYRYPEHIPYCSRKVDSQLKREIIREYDQRFNYQIEQMARTDFKIDHLIPLCMGGSNEKNNLWPQHETIFVQTDLIEQNLCEMMQYGKMKQSQAVATILRVKHDLSLAKGVQDSLTAELKNIRH